MSETGLKDDPLEMTEPDRLRLRMLAESTESRLATGATDEEVLDPRTVGRRIALGKPNPSILRFLGPIVFGASGIAVSPIHVNCIIFVDYGNSGVEENREPTELMEKLRKKHSPVPNRM